MILIYDIHDNTGLKNERHDNNRKIRSIIIPVQYSKTPALEEGEGMMISFKNDRIEISLIDESTMNYQGK